MADVWLQFSGSNQVFNVVINNDNLHHIIIVLIIIIIVTSHFIPINILK